MFNIDKGAPPATINDGGDENEEHSKLGSCYLFSWLKDAIEATHGKDAKETTLQNNILFQNQW